MTDARNHPRFAMVLAAVFPLLSLLLTAQEKREFSYTVEGKAVISITNDYGPITVKPSGNRQVVVQTVSRSDAISFANERHSNRIEIRSVSSSQETGLVDYTVLVPADAFVTLRTSDGTLHAQGLRGDVILESATALVEVIAISDAHLHVRTLSGPITLTDIRNSHLDVHSVSGNVSIHNVTGPSVKVNSGRGRVTYEGDPGPVGEYLLSSHSGDLAILIPASASVDIKACSIKGQSDEEFPKPGSPSALGQGNLLMKPGTLSRSRFELRSFSGKIRLKRP